MNIFKYITTSIIMFVFVALLYVFKVPINIYDNITLFYLIPLAVVLALIASKRLREEVSVEYVSVAVAFSITIALMLSVFSSFLFTAETRYKQLDTPQEVSKSFFDNYEIRKVTKEMAEIKAKKVLGYEFENKNISSQFKIGKGSAIFQNGTQKWVFPLEYKSVWKWLSLEHSPGYVVVSATDTNAEANLVIKKMKYVNSAWFSESIPRIAWNESGLRTTDEHFEIDEDGNPYYISGVYKAKALYGTKVVETILLINAVTGEVQKFDIQNAPDWIDMTVPAENAETQLDWQSMYHNGWVNAYFVGENVYETTGVGLWNIVIENETYYFTGLSSKSLSDDSLVSIRLLNARTMEQFEVKNVTGYMNEEGALEAIDSKLGADSERWKPVLPQIKFVDGQMYYFASVVSVTDIFQKQGAVQANNPTNVFYGKTVDEIINKIRFKESLSTEETTNESIMVKKEVFLKIMKKIDELNKLKSELQ